MTDKPLRIEKRVLRFTIDINDDTQVFPMGKVVHAMPNRDGLPNIELWIECTTDEKFPETGIRGNAWGKQKLRIFGTGHPIQNTNTEHLFSIPMGRFIWHLYRIYDIG